MSGLPLRRCPIGCSGEGRRLGDLATTSGGPYSRPHYTLTQCACGELLYLSPPPSDSDLRALYVEQTQFEGHEYKSWLRAMRIVRYMRKCLSRIGRARGWKRGRPLRVLEVGAGLSWMCRAAKSINPDSATVAQDISPEAVRRCPWVDRYVQGDVCDPRIDEAGPYDVVSMTHVIEHLVDVVAVARRCASLLAAGGVIFVTAPYRPRGWSDAKPDLAGWADYSYNHVPAHVQYFAKGSMERLAAAAGCELIHWSHEHDRGQAFEAWLARTHAG
jgi:SAM-dependent methyltransferase